MAKILLIEDDPLMINLYKKVFERRGYEVRISERGEEGLKMIQDYRPDLVMLDVMMPEMDGFEVLKRIKSDESTKNTAVVMLSNLAGEEDEARALEMGAKKYLVKSEYDPAEILKVTDELLSV